MTLNEFKNWLKIDLIPKISVKGHEYINPNFTKATILVNKDIKAGVAHRKLTVIPYRHYTYVISQDGRINPYGIPIYGKWTKGFAMDLHTLESTFLGENEYGREIYDTKRPWIAEELYQLKYKENRNCAYSIGLHALDFLKVKGGYFDLIAPVPPSDMNRYFQPVYEIASFIADNLNIPYNQNLIRKLKPTTELKSISDAQERAEMLKNAFDVDERLYIGKNILIIDDLYRSGSTLNAISEVLRNKGGVKNVFVLTITKTRSSR